MSYYDLAAFWTWTVERLRASREPIAGAPPASPEEAPRENLWELAEAFTLLHEQTIVDVNLGKRGPYGHEERVHDLALLLKRVRAAPAAPPLRGATDASVETTVRICRERDEALVRAVKAENEARLTQSRHAHAARRREEWRRRAEKAEAQAERLTAQVKRWEDKEVERAVDCCGQQERAEQAESSLAAVREALGALVEAADNEHILRPTPVKCDRCDRLRAALASAKALTGKEPANG